MRYARLLVLFLLAFVARPISAQQTGITPSGVPTEDPAYKRLAFSRTPTTAQGLGDPPPPYTTSDGYPILPRLTDGEAIKMMAKLGLHPVYLTEDRIMYNYYRNLKRDVVDTLHPGTLVYADVDGTPRYKASCWNRLREMLRCPACITAALSDSAAKADSLRKLAAIGATAPGFWATVGRNFGLLWDAFKAFMAWALPLLLLLLLCLILWILFGREFVRGFRTAWNETAPLPRRTAEPTPVVNNPGTTSAPAPRTPTMVNTPPAGTGAAAMDSDDDGHTVLFTAHPNGSHSVQMSPGVHTVNVRRIGTQQASLDIGHNGHGN